MNRAELRHRDLEVREHLEQQALDLDVGLVGLIDEEDGRVLTTDRGEQWPREQELLAEDVVVGLFPLLAVTGGLDPQQLLAVVPLIKGTRLVETLVALQPDKLGAGRLGDSLGELGLAGAGRALD